MGWRLISCVILAVMLMACQLAGVSVPDNISATNATNATITATNRPLRCMVVANSLYVRYGPGVEYPVAGYLYYGTTVKVVAQAQAADGGAWAQVDRGWVNQRWLECTN
jgi:uncharacterized protein YgiM (DUF1202 family)